MQVSVTTIREIKILRVSVTPTWSLCVTWWSSGVRPSGSPDSCAWMADLREEKPNDRSERGQVFMVFPFMDHDLCGLLSNPDFKVTHSLAKLLFRQILEGMAYIHAVRFLEAGQGHSRLTVQNNFLHRDIKTANIWSTGEEAS